MESFQLKDIKTFMTDLLVGDFFDEFLVSEISITTFCTFMIDGHLNTVLENQEFSSWKTLRPFCYKIIQGKKAPAKFKIVLISKTTENSPTRFLNIKFENGELTCVTGTSMRTFPPDKSEESNWDSTIQKLLEKYMP